MVRKCFVGMMVLGLGVGAAWGEDRPVAQVMATDPLGSENATVEGSLLVRELQRQGVLIGAREEMGLRTRDQAIGEDPGLENETVHTMMVGTKFMRGKDAQIILALTGGNWSKGPKALNPINVDDYSNRHADRTMGRVHIRLQNEPYVDYAGIATQAEAFSRADYLDALEKGEFDGKTGPVATKWVTSGAALPAAVRELGVMNPFAQFGAVRILHGQMRKEGASPERMEMLVRGYANLGFMTSTRRENGEFGRWWISEGRVMVLWPKDWGIMQFPISGEIWAGENERGKLSLMRRRTYFGEHADGK